jgi:hypothetical protein
MSSIYGPRLKDIGFDPAAGAHGADDPDQQKLRQSLVSLVSDEAQDAATRKTLESAAQRYLKGERQALDQSFYQSAMMVHVQEGGLAASRDMYERLVTSDDELFRSAALMALGFNRRADDARWLLTQFKDQRLRSTDRIELMQGLMLNEETRDIAFDWLKVNYDDFARRAGIFAASWIPALPSHYCSAAKADEIDQLLRPKVKQAGRGELPFNRMLESIRICGALKQQRAGELASALRTASANRE